MPWRIKTCSIVWDKFPRAPWFTWKRFSKQFPWWSFQLIFRKIFARFLLARAASWTFPSLYCFSKSISLTFDDSALAMGLMKITCDYSNVFHHCRKVIRKSKVAKPIEQHRNAILHDLRFPQSFLFVCFTSTFSIKINYITKNIRAKEPKHKHQHMCELS